MAIHFSKGSGSKFLRTPDTLRSADTAEIVLGIGEGQIEGLENGFKSFYIGDTRLQNLNGTDNFEQYKLEILPGSGVDEKLEYTLGGIARTRSVNTHLSQNISVTRETQSGEIDFIEIRFAIQGLVFQNDKGIVGTSMKIRIEYKPISSAEWIKVYPNDLTISGKTTSVYAKEIRWKVERIEESYEIRVTKLTQDTDTYVTSEISWESFQEVIADTREFPHTALAHLTIKSTDQFSSIPDFSGVYKLMKVKIPSNYDPINRTYDGVWDGTFKVAWSDNPAWCLYDFIMNDRYGVRAYSEVTLDKWDTYEAAIWCDELVSDGRGGKQPRYTYNAVIADARNGKEQASYMAGSFNAVLVEEATGYLRLKLDKDTPAVCIFAPENVVNGSFTYTFTDPETRFNDITVTFTNPELNWSTDKRRIFNNDEITKNGRVATDFAAVGCIREGEALRRAYYRLITSLTEKLTVSFQTNRMGQVLSNFDVILISDPTMGYALSGRIKNIDEQDRKILNLRDSVYLEAGISYNIQFNLPDGTFETQIDSLSGKGNLYTLILKDPVPDNLPEKAVFTISGSSRTGTPKPFRVLSIVEEEGDSEVYSVTAIEINRKKWEAADNLEMAYDDEYSGLPSATNIPYALDVSFSEYYDAVNVELQLVIGTVLDYNAYPYYSDEIIVYSREVGTEAWERRQVVNNNVVIDHPAGRFEFVVLPTSILGNSPLFEGAPVYVYEVTNLKNPPGDVTGLTAEQFLDGVQLSWNPNKDIDLKGYEIRDGESWDNSELVVTNYSGNKIFVGIKDNLTHRYLVKAIDGLGNYSINAASVLSYALPPDNVEEFWVTANNDNMRFDWKQVPGVDIQYVIKKGDTWESGIEILRTKGNNATVLLPSYEGTYFTIKALSKAGLYSLKPRFAKPDLALDQNRNIIIEVDNGADGFPGISYNFEPHPTLPNILVMADNAVFAEHYFDVSLLKEIRARNWFETQAFSFGERLTWEDLHYRYNSEEAHITWINSQELGASGDISTVIATKSLAGYTGLLGFTLDNTLKDYTEQINASTSELVTYSTGRLTDGLFIQKGTKVEWTNLEIPEMFSLSLKIRVTNQTPSSFKILDLKNNNTQEFMVLYIAEGNLYLTVSDGQSLSVPVKWIQNLDFLTIAITQGDKERKIYYNSDYSGYSREASLLAKPVDTFDQIHIGD